MSNETRRFLRWLKTFIIAVATIGLLCGIGLRFYGLGASFMSVPIQLSKYTK